MTKVISQTLSFHYDEELFNNVWTSEADPTSLVLLNSGAMVEDATIAGLIANGGNYFTLPFYKDIEGNELNYDGATDLTSDDTQDGVQSGVVYGRMKGWENTLFINDFTSADPMRNILNRVLKWKGKKVQARVISILEAILGITGSTGYEGEWQNHKMDITSSSSTVTDDNKIGLTTLRDLAVQAQGENADDYALAIMHSQVANRLSQFNVLEYFKYNDANGQAKDVRVAKSGNMTILICDEVPHSVDTNGNMVYTTYVLGNGVLRHANAPVEKPSDVVYDPVKRGGMEYLYTRYRETIHPNGFTFSMANLPVSPTDAQLGATANWSIVMNPKNIAIASLKTNG